MPEPTDMLAREIEEELRRERLFQLWDKYGTYVLAVALAVVVGVGGCKYYESRQAQANEAASTRSSSRLSDFAMQQARRGAEGARGLGRERARRATRRSAGCGWPRSTRAPAISRRRLAAYEEIAKDSSVDPMLADYANLQIAMLKLDSASFTELRNRLTPLAARRVRGATARGSCWVWPHTRPA